MCDNYSINDDKLSDLKILILEQKNPYVWRSLKFSTQKISRKFLKIKAKFWPNWILTNFISDNQIFYNTNLVIDITELR